MNRRGLFRLAGLTLSAGGVMAMRGDELDDLFKINAQPTQAQNMTYRQGLVLAWDQNTLANTVQVGGNTFTNLPVLGVGEATTIRAGSIVGLMCVRGDGGETWAVIGRLVTPGTAEATDAVTLLNSQIYSDFIGDPLETINQNTYMDLPRVGPRVTVPVGPTGRVLVLVGAQMQWSTGFAANIVNQARIALDVSGANTIAASDTGPLLNMQSTSLQVSAGTIADTLVFHQTAMANITGLTPGLTTFKMMYRNSTAPANTSDVTRRTLTVIRL